MKIRGIACPHGFMNANECMKCKVEYVRQWRLRNGRRYEYGPNARKRYMRWVAKHKKEHRKIQIKHRLKKNFGITIKDYEDMLLKQEGKCAICGALPIKRRHAVDHDHKTGKVRALLCWRCNSSIGNFGDNAALLKKAAEYLESYNGSA